MESSVQKRSREDDDILGISDGGKVIDKQPCKYGSECYRKNPQHFEKFSHPGNLRIAHHMGVKFH